MTQYGFYFNASRCIKCHACEIACKAWNEVEEGPLWRQVIKVTSDIGLTPREMNISMACMHCAEPPCRDACPVGAISKRTDDGIVVVDAQKCIGCGFCSWACPYGAPQFGKSGKMQKCNYCSTPGSERTHDLPRACEEVCPTNAIVSGPISEIAKIKQAEMTKRQDGTTLRGLPSLVIDTDVVLSNT